MPQGERGSAPRLSEALCEDCRLHFDAVLEGLDRLGIAYEQDDFLVRGLDYYTRTTFEYGSDTLEGVGGGGRYDGLVAALGGPERLRGRLRRRDREDPARL